jgi:hypothetical protein
MGWRGNFHVTTPHGLHGFFRRVNEEDARMKVKLFWANNPLGPARFTSSPPFGDEALENEINQWLLDHANIKIIDIRQSASGGSWKPSLWLISVWYEEGRA